MQQSSLMMAGKKRKANEAHISPDEQMRMRQLQHQQQLQQHAQAMQHQDAEIYHTGAVPMNIHMQQMPHMHMQFPAPTQQQLIHQQQEQQHQQHHQQQQQQPVQGQPQGQQALQQGPPEPQKKKEPKKSTGVEETPITHVLNLNLEGVQESKLIDDDKFIPSLRFLSNGNNFTCQICKKNYDQVKKLKTHFKQEHGNQSFNDCIGELWLEPPKTCSFFCPVKNCKRSYDGVSHNATVPVVGSNADGDASEAKAASKLNKKGFNTMSKLRQHFNRSHIPYDQKMLVCEKCAGPHQFRAAVHNDLIQHQKECGREKRIYYCDMATCSGLYASVRALRRHCKMSGHPCPNEPVGLSTRKIRNKNFISALINFKGDGSDPNDGTIPINVAASKKTPRPNMRKPKVQSKSVTSALEKQANILLNSEAARSKEKTAKSVSSSSKAQSPEDKEIAL